MTKCQVCGRLGQGEGDVCAYCGATVSSVLGKGQPLPAEVAREFEEEKRRRESGRAESRTRQLKRHAKVGALVFYAFGLLLLFTHLFMAGIFPMLGAGPTGSLATRLLIGLLLMPVYSAVLGAPSGLAVSKWKLGPVKSGVFGALVFFAAYLLLGMRFVLGALHTVITAFVLAAFGFVYGATLSVGISIDSEGS